MTSQETPYKDFIDWLQFAYTRDTKGGYVAPANTDFYFVSPVEGEALFIPSLECLWTLYLGAYAGGATYTTSHGTEDRKGPHEGRELERGDRTHT